MIPQEELDRFESLVTRALGAGIRGQVGTGYALLELGLEWALTAPVHPLTGDPGPLEPGAEELAARYRHALETYGEDFSLGLAAELPRPLRPDTATLIDHSIELQQQARMLCASSARAQRRAQELLQASRRRRQPELFTD
jgi:hypothetical protein